MADKIPKMAPPDKLAGILKEKGYPVNGKMLRRLHRENLLPGIPSGRKLLIPIEKALELFENGFYQDEKPEDPHHNSS